MNRYLKYCSKLVTNLCWCIRKGFSPVMVLTCDVPFKSIPTSTRFPHPFSIVIGTRVVIGENCTIRQNVTIGTKRWDNGVGGPQPRIGNGVDVGAGAIVLGDVVVGDGCTIGAGAVVLKSVSPGMVVVTKQELNHLLILGGGSIKCKTPRIKRAECSSCRNNTQYTDEMK